MVSRKSGTARVKNYCIVAVPVIFHRSNAELLNYLQRLCYNAS